jgi:hypothetical protein
MATNPSIILGYKPADIPDPLETRVRQQQLSMLAGQQQLQQQQLVGAQQENAARDLQMKQTQTLNDAYKGALTISADGTASVDNAKLTQGLAAGGAGSRIPDVLKGVNEYQKSIADLGEANGKVAALQNDAAGGLGATVKNADYDPHLFLTLAQHALDAKAVDPKFVAPMITQVNQLLQQDPTGAQAKAVVQQLSDHFITQSPAQQKLISEGQTAQGGLLRGEAARDNAAREKEQADKQDAATMLANQKTQADYTAAWEKLPAGVARKFPLPEAWTPQTSAAVLRVGMTPAQQQEADDRAAQLAKLNTPAELAFKAAKGDPDAKAALDLLEKINIRERGASSPVINITPQGQQVINDTVKGGGTVSIPRGPGAQVIANAYNDIGRQNAAGNAPPVDLNSARTDFAANKASLIAMQKQSDALDAYGAKFIGNLQQFKNIIQKIPDSGSPYLNTPIRNLDQKALGAAVYGRLNVARTIAANEGGRILAGGGNLGGVVSDNARHEIGTLLDKDATLGQWLSAIDQLQTDYNITTKAMSGKLADIRGRIRTGTPAAQAPATSATPAPVAPHVQALRDKYKY